MAKKCFICKAPYAKVPELLDHLEDKHGDQIPDDMSVNKFYYAHTHGGITTGKCQQCKDTTEFDEKTGRPFVLCKKDVCREKSRQQFRNNMIKATGKEHVCGDADHQKNMIRGRKGYGEYKFADGGMIGYLCKLELEFLRFCDVVMDFSSQEIEEMGVVLKYRDENNVERLYILDYFLNMYNLIIEIKEGGDNPNTHPNYIANTKNKEVYKDMTLLEQKDFNVVKIYNNDFRPLVRILFKIKNDTLMNKKPTKQFIDIEDKLANKFYQESSMKVDYRDLYLVEFREKYTQSLITFGITDSVSLRSVYLPVDDVGFVNTSINIAPLRGSTICINKFTGDKDLLTNVLNTFNGTIIEFASDDSYQNELLKILYDFGINIFIDHTIMNNTESNDFELILTIDEFVSLKQIQAVVFDITPYQ